jgi:2-methyl-3-hydroxypyridine 5-carboxylic acid dioxygenase
MTSPSSRHAEIAGAGFAGLTVATALAQRGWSVRLHEQSDQVRDFGAGILIWRNAMLSLDLIGVGATVRGHSQVPDFYETQLNGRLVSRELPGYPYWAMTRPRLHHTLAEAARAAGVEIVTGSRITGADPRGCLLRADGSAHKADLVIGSDGAGSAVRRSLALVEEHKRYRDGVVRVLIPRPAGFTGGQWDSMIDFWTLEPDVMRILYVPTGPETIYLGFMAETSNEVASRIPIDAEIWSARFPHLAPLVELAALAEGGRHDSYQTNRVTPWWRERAVLVGDSAHAMCPALAQGAGVGIVNAVDLALALDQYPVIEEALAAWERRQRGITDLAQSQTAHMAETRSFAQGNGWTRERLRTANYVAAGVTEQMQAGYPVPAANRS